MDDLPEDLESHWMYYRCPKCAALFEVQVSCTQSRGYVNGISVRCWNHEERIEPEFVGTRKSRASDREKDYLNEMGDKYESIERHQWQDRAAGGAVLIQCNQCLADIIVSENNLHRDDGDERHVLSETAVFCDNCDWVAPVRIRGYYEDK